MCGADSAPALRQTVKLLRKQQIRTHHLCTASKDSRPPVAAWTSSGVYVIPARGERRAPTLALPVEPAAQAPTDGQLAAAVGVSGRLAAPVRLHMGWLLCRGEFDVHTLTDRVGVTMAAVSQHLAKLRLAGLVHARREGRRHIHAVTDPHLIAWSSTSSTTSLRAGGPRRDPRPRRPTRSNLADRDEQHLRPRATPRATPRPDPRRQRRPQILHEPRRHGEALVSPSTSHSLKPPVRSLRTSAQRVNTHTVRSSTPRLDAPERTKSDHA